MSLTMKLQESHCLHGSVCRIDGFSRVLCELCVPVSGPRRDSIGRYRSECQNELSIEHTTRLFTLRDL
jgi:hypothetical protein